MTGNFKINNNDHRFELELEGGTAFADYKRDGDTLYINYVESPVALRGTGAAGSLMQEILNISKAENLKIVPICGYAASWLKRHNK
jgi:predicted GNAT family acetyltransferase